MQLIKIIVNILRKKGTQTIRFVLLCYGIRYINSMELFFRDQTLPKVSCDIIILKVFIL